MSLAPNAIVAPAAVTAAGSATIPARSVQWGAVILGALGAMAISMVLLAFGVGIGLSATSAQPYAGASAKAMAVISALYAAVTLVGSFAAGGYIAGRMRLPPTVEEVEEADFRDGAHGFAVWALAIVIGGMLAASGIGGVLKTAVQVGAGVASGTAAGAASNPVLGQAAANQISMTPTDYAIDRLMAPAPASSTANAAPPAATPAVSPGSGGIPAPPPPQMAGTVGPAGPAVPSRADLSAPMTRTFAASLRSGQLEARDRSMLVQTVMQQTGLPQAEAEKRVDDAYAELKANEQKARDAADKARKAGLIGAFAAAATLLLGCAAACVGAASGAKHRHERTAIVLFRSRRFW